MVQRTEPDPVDRDERLGEAIEAYLALAEGGHPPDPEAFASRYPDLSDDLRAALEGLALVQGLVGDAIGPGHRLESGRRIAGYRIVRELGRGGMGTVYEAVHVGLDRPVALKVLGSHAAPDSTGRRRFLNEARTAAGLHHTHIVPVFDVGQVGGLCYYAMQRIEGSGLDHVLRFLRRDRATAAGSSYGGTTPALASGRLRDASGLGDATLSRHGLIEPEALARTAPGGRAEDDAPTPFAPPRGSAYYRWVAEVGRQAAEALAHAHQRGIIHRDIKPSNLLIDARGMIWVADFGLARRLADPSLTQHDSLLGTPRYMSPEQARIGPIDGRSDIYSLGATLFELLTLRPPFEGRSAAELIDQIAGREPVSPRVFDARVPRDLETIVLKMLAKRPGDRYASASELADDLGRFLNREPVRARRIGPVGRLWRFARRHPSLTAVSTAASIVVLTTAIVSYVRIRAERDQARDAKAETQAAMRTQLWRSATVVRFSNVPNRRVDGLGLLKESAALGPDAALRANLRNEAVEFLVLRDVERRPVFATGPTRGLAFGGYGDRLATIAEDGGQIGFWDVATHRRLMLLPLRAEPPPPGRRRGWRGAEVATLGAHVAVVRADGRGLRLFDPSGAAAPRDVDLPGHRLQALYADPGGHRLVTVESQAAFDMEPRGESQINLWDPADLARPLATLVREAGPPGRDGPLVAIAPDGRTVATARSRKTAVALWSGDDGRALGSIESQAELSALALGPDGLLATAGGGAIRLWDADSGAPLPTLDPHQSIVRLMKFNPSGTLLAVAGAGANVELWDPALHTLVAALPTPDRVEDLAFAPDGRTLAAAGAAPTTSLWTVVDPVGRTQLSGFDSAPTSLAFRRGDSLLVVATRKGTLRSWCPDRCPSTTRQASRPPSPRRTPRRC